MPKDPSTHRAIAEPVDLTDRDVSRKIERLPRATISLARLEPPWIVLLGTNLQNMLPTVEVPGRYFGPEPGLGRGMPRRDQINAFDVAQDR